MESITQPTGQDRLPFVAKRLSILSGHIEQIRREMDALVEEMSGLLGSQMQRLPLPATPGAWRPGPPGGVIQPAMLHAAGHTGLTPGSLTDRVLTALESAPERDWSCAEVAEACGMDAADQRSMTLLRSALFRLANDHGKIARAERGKYRVR